MSNKFSSVENLLLIARDKFLVKESISGNPKAFSTLMFLYKKRVESIGLRFFHNQNDTDDFVQEVFIKVFNNLKSYKGESKFSTWITRIAFNTAVNSKSRKKTADTLNMEEGDNLPSIYDSPEEAEMKKITKLAIQQSVKELPENYAKCVEMYFFMDMTYEDISETTGIPVNTLKTHIFRAKKILYEKLKELQNE